MERVVVIGLYPAAHAEFRALDADKAPCERAPEARIRVVTEPRPGEARCVTLGLGLGASIVTGANADGYSPGLAQRASVDVATGRYVQFSGSLDHTRHTLLDAGAYIPGVTVPATSLSGFRDYFVADIGFRYHIPVVILEPQRITASPWLRTGLAVVITSTRLDGPGFTGPVAMRSNQAWPALSIGAGAELRLTEWLAVDPHLLVQGMLLPDASESNGGQPTLSSEVRFQPALDVSARF